MTNEEEIYYSNRAWLSLFVQKPKNVLRVNDIVIDRLTRLGYVEVIGSYVIATDKGRAYVHNLEKEE